MTRVLLVLPFAVAMLAGCASAPPVARGPSAPAWVEPLLESTVGEKGAAAARDHLFRTVDDGELFAGLVAFARARDPELRQVAAFHLPGSATVARECGIDAGPALETLRQDIDPEVRRIARLQTAEEFLDHPLSTGIVSGDALVGVERLIPYPGLERVTVHLLVSAIEPGSGTQADGISYEAEARVGSDNLFGSAGGHGVPDATASGYMGMGTTDAQYGWNLWLRVLDDGTVRWWLQGLRKASS